MKQVTIYTDGACDQNPGRGGYGVVIKYGKRRKELSGGYELTTNNRMEIMAAIKGLEALKDPSKVTLYSDSRYLVDAVKKEWVYKWQANDWYRTKKEKVANADLWERLLSLCARHEVQFVWVRGHAGNKENERCDFLSYRAIENKNLPEDKGYKSSLLTQQPAKEKIVRVGQPCRKCSTPVIKKRPKQTRKPGQKYYYEYYLYCPNCGTTYMVGDAKREFGSDRRLDI